jgi:hypothetical protein
LYAILKGLSVVKGQEVEVVLYSYDLEEESGENPSILRDEVSFPVGKLLKGQVENLVVYVGLGVDLEGYCIVLGHWPGDGAEGTNSCFKSHHRPPGLRRQRHFHCLNL